MIEIKGNNGAKSVMQAKFVISSSTASTFSKSVGLLF